MDSRAANVEVCAATPQVQTKKRLRNNSTGEAAAISDDDPVMAVKGKRRGTCLAGIDAPRPVSG